MKNTFYILVLVLLAFSTGLNADQIPSVNVTLVLSTDRTADGQLLTLPKHPQVVVSIYEIAPGAVLPMHQHPYPRYAYVLAGTLEVTIVGGKTYRYKAGDFIVEAVGRWHTARNIGVSAVRLLVIDQAPPGRTNTIFPTHKHS